MGPLGTFARDLLSVCRTAALGGHVERCESCAHTQIACNSCRNRNCPKCQGAAVQDWLADREAELLPVPSFHVVFTLPAAIGDLAWSNKAVIYDPLFKAAAETLLTLAADPKHLGARIGLTAVLHSWGSALTHHPHVHVIVPGGGLALDGSRWIACRPGFFLPVGVLSRLFRRLFLDGLACAQAAGRLGFFGAQAHLAQPEAFSALLAALRRIEWVVYCKRPLRGPVVVLPKYAEPVTARGFVFMDTPGFDPVSATGQAAGGANVVRFTTGRGSVFGCKPSPSIKIATNTPMYRRMEEDMDVNCGTIVDGEETVQQARRRIFDLILRVASGERTKVSNTISVPQSSHRGRLVLLFNPGD